MEIGKTIRKYRKEKALTQEEMANRLGVSAPAVNKWENGNAMPDILLLAPIARLLGISLDELLSFQDTLSEQDIRDITKEADKLFEAEPYEIAFQWAKKKLEQYPNCEELIFSLSVMMDANRKVREVTNPEQYDPFIIACYERLRDSNTESIRLAGADALFGYYFHKGQYEKAQEYLNLFSIQNPERKRKQALLYEKTGEIQKAFQTYEELLLSDYQIMDAVLNDLQIISLKQKDFAKAQYYVAKRQNLARLLEMGEYRAYSAELELVTAKKDCDRTLSCVQGMLEHIDTLGAFTKAPLYAHMTYKKLDADFLEKVKQELVDSFRSGEEWGYMRDDPRWENLFQD